MATEESAGGAELVVLGAGSILPRAGYGCAGYALRPAPGRPVTLFDCGPGSVRMLGAVGIELGEVERVVLSHYHPDHCLDLLALFFARKNPQHRARPLEIVGPVGLLRLVASGEAAFGGWVRDPDCELLEVRPDAAGGLALERAGARFSAVRTLHTPDALAWRVDLDSGESLTYSGDSPETPAVGELASGCDLFVCECSFREEEATDNHLTPRSAGRLAARAGCRTLLLTHFYPGLEPEFARAGAAEEFDGRIEAARDGSRHALRRA